jgi:hypothetical protein
MNAKAILSLALAAASLSHTSALATPPVAAPDLRLRSDQGVILDSNDLIERWEDLSGNARHFEQSTAAKRPSLLSNGWPVNEGTLHALPANQNGNSTWGGSLGMDFEVISPITITHLAAFDHARDGFTGTITVQLQQRDTAGTPATFTDDTGTLTLEQLTFTNAEPGDLGGCFRWKPLAEPRTLAPGTYTIISWGYTGSDSYYSSQNQAGDFNHPSLRWDGGSRYANNNQPGGWPQNVPGNFPDYYAGSLNFRFHPENTTPTYLPAISFDGTDDGLHAISSLNITRPSSIFVVYQRDDRSSGYVIQNTTGSHWFVRNDGFYAGNWIRNTELPWWKSRAVSMIQAPSATNAWENLDDVSADTSPISANPGRLALGGGSGLGNDPLDVRITEVIAYDRLLTDAELRLTQSYLTQRYGILIAPAANPSISPPPTPGSGPVTVTLASITPGSEIRYTLDGSEPTAASTLYSAPISVPRETQLKARAFLAGTPPSGVASAFYLSNTNTELPVADANSWLRADRSIETDHEGRILRWGDLTGNGNDMAQLYTAQRPSLTDAFPSSGGTAITPPGPVTGTNTHNGTLGADFEVDQTIEVTQLAAFDHLFDGFASSVTVQLWSRNNRNTTLTPEDDLPGSLLAEMEFTPGSPGTLNGSYRYKSLPSAITLPPGSYSILAWGYTGSNFYRNSSDATWNNQGIRFVNVSRYNGTNGAWPTTMDSHPVKYNGAGNFLYQLVSSTPSTRPAIQFDGSDDGLISLANSNLARPSTVFLVFKRESNGQIIQGNSSNWWFLRNDGAYSNGWISNRTIPFNESTVATFSNNSAETRFHINGEDWTVTPNVPNVVPGRLAIGGGSGYSYSPSRVQIAELITYNRILSDAERWQIEKYLSTRYSTPPPQIPFVNISPSSNNGSDPVEVTLSGAIPGATVRYTTNGSDPDESSTAYTAPFQVTRPTTLKVRQFFDGSASPVSSAFYGQTSDAPPVSGASLWVKADQGIDLDTNGNVARWRDLSGSGNDFIQPESAKRPRLDSAGLSTDNTLAILTPPSDGGSVYTGTLAEDFVVTQPIEITHLAAFDHRRDGFAGTITVQLWSRNNNSTPLTQTDDTPNTQLAQLTFTSTDPGSLDGAVRSKPLLTPITLPAGSYTILAWGYTGSDRYHEGARSRSHSDPRFSFIGSSRFSATPGGWPTSLDSVQLDYNGAANFRFTPATAPTTTPALIFDGSDDSLLALPSLNTGRPSTVIIAFQFNRTESGYVIQNNSGPHWFIRNDGFYSNAWIRNQTFPNNTPFLATMVNGTSLTRAYLDSYDVTTSTGSPAASPGRLALGGGSGIGVDPAPVSISEVIVFNRTLNETELWQMHQFIATRNQLELPPVNSPTVSPSSNSGSGNVEVSLASTTPSAEIRYTTDGSEPNETSTLYTAPFSVPRPNEVRARAFLTNSPPSGISSATFLDSNIAELPASSPALWLRADRGLSLHPNGSVARWDDLSGNGRHMVQTEPTLSPTPISSAFGGAIHNASTTPSGQSGGTNYTGSVGTDFITDRTLEITHFGAFDHLSDGFAGTINVTLHSVNDNGTPTLASDDSSSGIIATQSFTAANPGELDGATRYIELGSPLSLPPGRYCIVSSGWIGADSYHGADAWDKVIDRGITYPNVSRFNTSNIFPGTLLFDSRYLHASGFRFRNPGDVRENQAAVRFDGVNDGMAEFTGRSFGRPSTVFMVYRQLHGTMGRLIQSNSGQNWLLGPHSSPQGFYANGWVSQISLRRNIPSLSIAIQDTLDSRFIHNGQDLTQDRNPTGILGSVAIGGASGTYFQPTTAELAELVIYDRVLTNSERLQVTAALNQRYNISPEPLPPPSISPDGGLHTEGQTVSLSHPVPGVEIRYTLDDSPPDESSPLDSAPFLVNTTSVVRARAYAPGYLPSQQAEGHFFIESATHAIPQRQALQLWLRAGIGSEASSGPVSTWRDLSGKGMDATQSTAANRPSLTPSIIGSAPAMVFDGSNDHFQIGEGFSNFSNGLTTIIVTRPDQIGNWQRFYDFGRGTNYFNLFTGRSSNTTNFMYSVRNGGSPSDSTAPNILPSLSNSIIVVSHLPNGNVKTFHNGSLITEANGIPLPPNISRFSNYIARSNWSSDAYFSGAISEILLYNTALGDLERETLEQNIRSIYGISTSATGTVAFSPDPAQLYPSGATVSLTSITPEAVIRYTVDGSTPTESSPIYSAPLSITSSTRIRARAFAEGFNASQFSEATYLVGQPPSSGDGLLGTYFDNVDFTGASLTRVDPVIDFNWGGGSPDPGIGADTFSVRWTGKLIPRFTETYSFFSTTDDGGRLWIDLNNNGSFEDTGEQLINSWFDQSGAERTSTPVNLIAGQLYNFRFDYYENGGGASAVVRWSSFSEPKAIIPQSQLFSNAEFSQTVTTPVISPVGGTYTAAVNATVTTATPGATIYYTTDGSIPDTNSQVYGGPVNIAVSGSLRARAYKAGFNPSGVSTVNYNIDAQPPLITQFAWNSAAINNGETFINKGVFSATATDNQGITRAEFFYQPSGSAQPFLIGTDNHLPDGLSIPWDIAGVSDGPYTVSVRVFDTSGTWSQTSRTINVALAAPAAPSITIPASGITIQDPVVALRVESTPNANIRIFRDDTFIFSGYANTSGILNYSASLPTGTSVFKAVAANRAGNSSQSNLVSVTRVREFPLLTLTFDNNTVGEGSSVEGTVSIPAPVAEPVVVNIATNKASQFESILPVTIPAGETSATFPLTARQDSLIEAFSNVTVSISAIEHRSAEVILFLSDDDYPVITLTLDRETVSENETSLIATVTRATATDRALRIDLTNTRPNDVTVPSFIEIPANAPSRTFTIPIANNSLDDGNRTATIQGKVFASATEVAATSPASLEIRDDEGPLLTLEVPRPFAEEGSPLSATVRRAGGPNTSPLVVTLSHLPVGAFSHPPTVTIPAGQDSAPVSFQALASPLSGNRAATLRAAAVDFTDALSPVTITDEPKAELTATNLTAPAEVRSEEYATITYQINNLGFSSATGPFSERIFFSTDPSLSGDDLLLRQIDQTGETAPGAYYGRNVTVLTPRQTGTYYMIVSADTGNAVPEIDETNNTTVLVQPIVVRAAYQVSVQTSTEVVPANTPILFTGQANRDDGQPARFSMVNIHITVNGSSRVISAVTNSIGEFSTTWTPLRNEGGIYTIGATHPGSGNPPVQDSFEILTIGLNPPAGLVLNEGESLIAEATITNPNERELTGIALSVSGVPAGMTITPQLPATTLGAGDQMTVPISVSVIPGFSGYGSFPLTVATAEGVTMQAAITVRADLLVPVLTIAPTQLSTSVLRGDSKTESFTITNTGGLASGTIQILLPDLRFLSLATPALIPSLAPGESASVSLQLAPSSTQAFTAYTGNLAINPANGTGRTLPFNFRVVSDLKGDLTIDVADELTYFTDAGPKVEGANVILRDAITSAPVATITTGPSGSANFTQINEGWYRVEVTAPEHDSFSGNYYITAGEETVKTIFISKQLVRYAWTVEEVEIEDTYRVTVETTFETNVPAPVVTASPSTLDASDLIALGQTKIINVTLENHGFIDAQNSEFRFSDHPFYEFTPLVRNVGTIPAKSSLVVPIAIRRIGVFDENGDIITLDSESPFSRNSKKLPTDRRKAPGGSVPCGAAGALDYDYPCGEWAVEKVVVLAISGIQGSCGGSSGPGGGGYIGFIGGFYGPGGSSGPGGGSTGPSGGGQNFTSPDPCLPICLARAAIDCAINFTPAGCAYAIGQCVITPAIDNCAWAAVGCLKNVPIVNGANCVYSFGKCFYEAATAGRSRRDGPVPLTEETYILDDEYRNFAPDVAAAWSRCEPMLRLIHLQLGSKEFAIASRTPEGKAVTDMFAAAIEPSSPSGLIIDASEADTLEALASGALFSDGLMTASIARWNRTQEYWNQDIYEIADVPSGQDTDFITRSLMQTIAQQMVDAFEASQADGYIDPFDEFIQRSNELRETLLGGQGGACARVKVQLSQDVVMTRTAFRATLDLQNQRAEPLEEVSFELRVRDENGLPAEDLFNVQVTQLSGLDAIDGSGTIAANANGTAQWTLIPRDTAALEAPTSYTVGGVIRYNQGGNAFTIPVSNVPITVRPDASLDLKYFHQRDVFSDDPYTDEIEPAQPYKLAVMVENKGFGEARNLRIISGQPKIVDNEKGLFIDFKIIGTEVDGSPLTPSLTADFGNVAPGQRKIATWLMTSTLQGLFTEYSATFEHISGLGDPRISLLQNVEIHEMIRSVRDQRPGSDSAPDFLTNDVVDANDFPDTIHYSDGGTDLVTVRQTGNFTGTLGGANLTLTLNAGTFSGWSYLRLPDPANGAYRLLSATRSDGRVLPLDFNVWQSDRTFIGGGRQPNYEHILHIVDHDSTGTYTLVYTPAAAADTTPPSSSVTALPPLSPANIPVIWSGTDDSSVAHYNIYAATNGGPFTLWRERITSTGAVFNGVAGNTYQFYSIATDQAGNIETKTPAVEASTEVGVPNLPPVLAAISNQSAAESSLFSLQVSATDPDGPASAIRYSLGTNLPGVVIHPVTGLITWNIGETEGGKTANLIVVATDAGSPPATANRSFSINVDEINRAPSLSGVGPQTLQPNGILIVDLDANDPDIPSQTLTYSLANAPDGATIDPLTGIVQWSPNSEQTGQNHAFSVLVTDSGTPALTAQTAFSVNVVGAADTPPAFTQVPVVLWIQGKSYSLNVAATDPNGDPISLAANLTQTPGATFTDLTTGNGTLAWTPSAAPGTYEVPVTATANGASANAVVRIRIAEDNLYWNWAKDTFGDLPPAFDLSLLEMDADPDGDNRTNVHEMAFLTNPLQKDAPKVTFEIQRFDPFAIVKLRMHRRTGSNTFVDLGLQRAENLNGPWASIPQLDWSAFVDPTGDDDGRPETELMEFEIYEFHPESVPNRAFYRIDSTPKP